MLVSEDAVIANLQTDIEPDVHDACEPDTSQMERGYIITGVGEVQLSPQMLHHIRLWRMVRLRVSSKLFPFQVATWGFGRWVSKLSGEIPKQAYMSLTLRKIGRAHV